MVARKNNYYFNNLFSIRQRSHVMALRPRGHQYVSPKFKYQTPLNLFIIDRFRINVNYM